MNQMVNWTTACPDWESRVVAGHPLVPFDPLYPEEAVAALEVFKGLRIVDVPGRPTFGEACEPWVFDFVAAIFGAYDAVRAKRLITEFFLLISKKNAKSTIAAGIMVTALIRNWRHSAELLILAPTIEAANNCFKPAADMVAADPDLGDPETGLLQVVDHQRLIRHRVTAATLKVVSSDDKTVSGKKAAFVLIDELWLFGKQMRAGAMLREATGGLVSRPEGFVIYLSTQSDEPPAGVFKEKLDYARDVRDGRIEDPHFLAVIYEFPQEMIDSDAFLDPANFRVTNPNLGRSVQGDWLEREMRKEMIQGPETRNVFLAKHLNVEIGMNLRSNRWPGADFWAARAETGLDLDTLLERCEVVAVGVDGGGLDDLFGLAAVGRDIKTRNWLAWCHAWCHRGVLERRKSIASRLLDFQREGSLTIVDDALDDVSQIVRTIARIRDAGILGLVGMDPAGLGEFLEELEEIGVTQEAGLLIGVSQGGHLMDAIKTAERKLVNGTLWHDGSDLMQWCVGNIKIEPTATGIRATKAQAGDAKIDPAMALFDAVLAMMKMPKTPEKSYLEETGLVIL